MAGKDVWLPFLSSREGEGRGSAGRDLPEGGNLLKFILFFFTVKKFRIQKPADPLQAISASFSVAVRPIFKR